MALLDDHAMRPDTIRELEAAASDRLNEARMMEGKKLDYWGIYTYGYVVEMRLKSAFFHLSKAPPREDVKWYLDYARTWAAAIDVSRTRRNLHDLLWWATLLVRDRENASRPYSPIFSCELLAHVQIVANHWKETMRYHPAVDCHTEADSVARSVSWIELNYNKLWE